MQTLLDDPMIQAGVAPFLVALAVGWVLKSIRLSGLAIVAALATTISLASGIAFSPLTAGRKIVLLVLLAPLVGLAADHLLAGRRWVPPALALLAALASAWVFQTVLAQREGAAAWALGGGVAAFVAGMVWLALRLRDDGVAGGAATLGLGLAVGVAAILSASMGNMMNGIALAAAGGALLLLQMIAARAIDLGATGMLTAGTAAAYFTASTLVLSELRWPALVTLLLIPAAAALPLATDRGVRARTVLVSLLTILVASATVLAAWLATRNTAT